MRACRYYEFGGEKNCCVRFGDVNLTKSRACCASAATCAPEQGAGPESSRYLLLGLDIFVWLWNLAYFFHLGHRPLRRLSAIAC